MKNPRLSLFSLLFLPAVLLVTTAFAAEKSVFLPKGTQVEQTEDNCLRFTLPDGCAVQVRGFARSRGPAAAAGECGTIGDCAVFSGKGKLIATGKQGRILSGDKPGQDTAEEPGASLKVEGATLWLPATVRFEDARVFDRLALEKLSAVPDK